MIDPRKLEDISYRFGEAVIDPSVWPEIMDGICGVVGASGAVLLQSDVRTPDVPCTDSTIESTRLYFKGNWHLTDTRARAISRIMVGEIITDQDLLTPEQIRLDPMYNEVLRPCGLQWFAAVGFWADTAGWVLSIQRTGGEGPFEAHDKPLLRQLAAQLSATATLATAVGRTAIRGITNALGLIGQPALAIGRLGQILGINDKAEAYPGQDLLVRDGRLSLTDRKANSELIRLIDGFRGASGLQAISTFPIVIRRPARKPLVLQPLSVPPAARSPFLGARVIFILTDLEGETGLSQNLLIRTFNLTPAQARLAVMIGAGQSLEEASAELGVAMETARHHLKMIFSKTDTHRQGELVALLNKLRWLDLH